MSSLFKNKKPRSCHKSWRKMPEVRGDRPDWFEMTERRRVITQITTTKICRRPSLNTQTLKQMDSSKLGPHRVLLASV